MGISFTLYFELKEQFERVCPEFFASQGIFPAKGKAFALHLLK